MLNLAKVLCLLLAVKATSARLLKAESVDSAKKSFDKAMKYSLAKMAKSHVKNAACVRAAKSMVEWEIHHVKTGLELHPGQPKVFKGSEDVIKSAENQLASIDATGNSLTQIFETERRLLEDKQLLVDTCVSSHPDSPSQAASCIKKIRKTFPQIVKKAKSYFKRKCQEAKVIATNALIHLEVVPSFSDPKKL